MFHSHYEEEGSEKIKGTYLISSINKEDKDNGKGNCYVIQNIKDEDHMFFANNSLSSYKWFENESEKVALLVDVCLLDKAAKEL